MARHYIEFRIWLAPTVDTYLVTAVANVSRTRLTILTDAPLTIKAINYAIKREEEGWLGSTPVDSWRNHHSLTEQWFPPGIVARAMRRRRCTAGTQAERAARDLRVGLSSDPTPAPRWEFRRPSRANKRLTPKPENCLDRAHGFQRIRVRSVRCRFITPLMRAAVTAETEQRTCILLDSPLSSSSP